MTHKDVPRRSRRFADVDRCRLHFVVSWIFMIQEKNVEKRNTDVNKDFTQTSQGIILLLNCEKHTLGSDVYEALIMPHQRYEKNTAPLYM